jgi:hypothetical protein
LLIAWQRSHCLVAVKSAHLVGTMNLLHVKPALYQGCCSISDYGND